MVQKILLTVGMLIASTFYWRGDIMFIRWPMVLALLSVLLGYQLAKKLHWSAFFPFVLTCLQCIWLYAWPENQYEDMVYYDILAISKMASYRQICFILTIISFAWCSRKMLKDFYFACACLCFLNSVFVIYQTFDGQEPFYRGGFLGNASINSCFIAVLYPFLVFRKKLRWDTNENTLWSLMFLITPVLAILLPEQSMPIGTLLVAVAAFLTAKFGFKYVTQIGVSFVLICICLYAWLGQDLIYNNGRLPVWNLMMTWWKENANPLFGIGPGLSSIFIPHLQKVMGVSWGAYWIFAHNDWLQLLFEQGILGLLAFGTCVFYCLKFSVGTPYLFSAACAYTFCALANWPTHNPVFSVVGALIAVGCLREGKHGNRSNTVGVLA